MKDCNFCGCEKCECNKKQIVKNISITEGELNALEDFAMVDLKWMAENRPKELEVLQERAKSLWKKLIKKVD